MASTGAPTDPTVELVLVRHGESEGNVAREQAEASGAEIIDVTWRDADVPLSARGRQQAAAVAGWLGTGSVDSAWSSPYLRARDTAQLALGRDCAVIARLDERLRDRELGILDGLTSNGVNARYRAEADRRRWLGKFYYRPPGGESWADVALRLRCWLAELPPDAGRTLVVTHDAVILLLRYICEQLTEAQILEIAATTSVANASITQLARSGNRWRLVGFDQQEHLGALVTEHPAERDVFPR